MKAFVKVLVLVPLLASLPLSALADRGRGPGGIGGGPGHGGPGHGGPGHGGPVGPWPGPAPIPAPRPLPIPRPIPIPAPWPIPAPRPIPVPVPVPLPPPAPSLDIRAINDLVSQTQQLDGQVRYSQRLSWSERDEVNRLVGLALSLQQCAVYTPFNGGMPGNPFVGPIPSGRDCSWQLNEVTTTFDRLESALAETYYTEPGIYREYADVRQAIDVLRASRPYYPPITNLVNVSGRLDSIPFNLSANRRAEIQLQCLQLARSYGILGGVRELIVNGLRYSNGPWGALIPIQEACRTVSLNAR